MSTAPVPSALALVRSVADSSASFQGLQPGMQQRFFGPDACVAYVDTGGAWVAAGPPIAPLPRRAEVARAFFEEARRCRRRACMFNVDASLCDAPGVETLFIGEEPRWELARWTEVLAQHRRLREQLRRARAKGVRARVASAEELGPNSPLRGEMQRIVERTLASRPLAPMAFLVDVHPFALREERLYVVAEQDGHVVAFATATPIPARRGWLLEHVMRAPSAPNGTAELIVDTLFRTMLASGSEMATLGLAPLAGDVVPVLALIRSASRRLYNFAGVHAFKKRLHPHGWEPRYLAFPRGTPAALATFDALRAFAPGGFVAFGLETAKRHPRLALTVVLVSVALSAIAYRAIVR